MKTLRTLSLCILILLLVTSSFAQELNWYSFDKDFVSAQYPSDSAIGQLKARLFNRAKTIHSSSCGGNDAELHIGILLDDIQIPNGQKPLSEAPNDDTDWGVVAELPNAKLGNGSAQLNQLANKAITFEGYFRVWDEGHAVGTVHPSNPHHVFEVHPAWGFSGEGVNFIKKNLVNSIAGYAGYGVKKFRPLLTALSKGDWPHAYQKSGKLYLGLVKAQNFYQLPVRITKITKIDGGHEVLMDVFSDKNHNNLVYSGLAGITVTGSPIDKGLSVGQETFLLGFFSVNLRKALEASQGADSADEAVAVKNAVEFFVFGFALKSAVQSCN